MLFILSPIKKQNEERWYVIAMLLMTQLLQGRLNDLRTQMEIVTR